MNHPDHSGPRVQVCSPSPESEPEAAFSSYAPNIWNKQMHFMRVFIKVFNDGLVASFVKWCHCVLMYYVKHFVAERCYTNKLALPFVHVLMIYVGMVLSPGSSLLAFLQCSHTSCPLPQYKFSWFSSSFCPSVSLCLLVLLVCSVQSVLSPTYPASTAALLES